MSSEAGMWGRGAIEAARVVADVECMRDRLRRMAERVLRRRVNTMVAMLGGRPPAMAISTELMAAFSPCSSVLKWEGMSVFASPDLHGTGVGAVSPLGGVGYVEEWKRVQVEHRDVPTGTLGDELDDVLEIEWVDPPQVGEIWTALPDAEWGKAALQIGHVVQIDAQKGRVEMLTSDGCEFSVHRLQLIRPVGRVRP